jgi:CubicO group peptidase (beta-lactamase class C family)
MIVSFSVTTQTNIQQKIDELLATYDSNDAPGLSVKVINQGESVYSKGFGLSNLDYNIKNSDSTIFSIASISKQFTAAGIWALVNDGKISLDDDIRMYLREFPEHNETIKMRHLLNHTSGITNYQTLMYLSGFDYDKEYYDNNTVLQLACKQKELNSLPGEKVAYSNTNYNLLALIIERVSGKNLNEYLKDKILNPLNMNNTFVRVAHGTRINNRAIGYQKRGDSYVYNVSSQLSYGAGSMGSSINDMAIWMQMLNDPVSEFKLLAEFLKTTEILNSGDEAKYARGIILDDYKGYTVANHSGFGFGERTQLIVLPELQIGIIVLSNLQSINAPRVAYQILDVLLSDKVKKIIKEEISEDFTAQDFNLFVGEYKEIHSDMTMKLFVENDTLKSIGSMGKTSVSLDQFAENKFHRTNSQNVKHDFTPSKAHDMSISFGGTPFYFKRAKFIDVDLVNLSDFVGDFYSEELDVTYHFLIEEDVLKLSYKANKNINLHPVQLNEFGNNDRTLYHFTKDEKDAIKGMLLSCDGTVKDIIFKKKGIAN